MMEVRIKSEGYAGVSTKKLYLCRMIFYFSGTGNTKWAAKSIAEALGEQLVSIPEARDNKCNYHLKEGEVIGFCFPTHGWQPPRIVREFISRLQISQAEGHYCFALTTCGDSIGKTMEILCKDLKKAGLPTPKSVFSLVMPESYVCLPFMYTDSPEREHAKIEKAKEQLAIFIRLIKAETEGEMHTVKGAMPWAMSHIIGNYFNKRMVTDKKFTVDEDQCIHCGMCQKVCPTGDLTFDGNLPSWRHDQSCTCCLACYHHCPRHAINYGSITRKRGQYYFGHGTPTPQK